MDFSALIQTTLGTMKCRLGFVVIAILFLTNIQIMGWVRFVVLLPHLLSLSL